MGFNKLKVELKRKGRFNKSGKKEVIVTPKDNKLITFFVNLLKFNNSISEEPTSSYSMKKQAYSEAQLRNDVSIATSQTSLLRQLNK
jgi:hypothetical protein